MLAITMLLRGLAVALISQEIRSVKNHWIKLAYQKKLRTFHQWMMCLRLGKLKLRGDLLVDYLRVNGLHSLDFIGANTLVDLGIIELEFEHYDPTK